MYIVINSNVILQFTTGFVCVIQPMSSKYWVEEEYWAQFWKKCVPAQVQETL